MLSDSEGSEGTLLLFTCVILGNLLNLSVLPKSFPVAKEYAHRSLSCDGDHNSTPFQGFEESLHIHYLEPCWTTPRSQ